MARHAAEDCRRAVVTALVQCSGRPQQGRTRAQRLAAAGRFLCRGNVTARRIVLFDDVCTTGATLRDAATAVRAAGGLVEHAVVLAVTRARTVVENLQRQLTPVDELFLQRAYELAARGIGSTAPNPPVGAVVVRDGRIVGEGYHHRAGNAHAESQRAA